MDAIPRVLRARTNPLRGTPCFPAENFCLAVSKRRRANGKDGRWPAWASYTTPSVRACGTLRGCRKHRIGRVVICASVCVQPSYVCEQVHYAPAPQLHDALRRRAHPSRDDAQPDGDDERRRDDERLLSDDAPAPDVSVTGPSQRSSLL
jgi:hypothetical protein